MSQYGVRGRGIDEIHKVQSPSLRVIRPPGFLPPRQEAGSGGFVCHRSVRLAGTSKFKTKSRGDYPRRSIIGGRRGQAYRHHLWEWSGLMLQPPRAESEKEGTATEERSSCVPRSHQGL